MSEIALPQGKTIDPQTMTGASFARLGLTHEVIERVFELVEAEDARLASPDFDKLHRGNNRWGHCLAALRRELKRHDWTWDTDPQGMRLIVSPDGEIQLSVAAASELGSGEKGPRPSTHPKGKYTQLAVCENAQLFLPGVEVPSLPHIADESALTWLLLHERRFSKETMKVEYLYEVSLPIGLSGDGVRQRVHKWGPQLLQGRVTFDAKIEEVPQEDRFDAGEDEDVPTIEIRA